MPPSPRVWSSPALDPFADSLVLQLSYKKTPGAFHLRASSHAMLTILFHPDFTVGCGYNSFRRVTASIPPPNEGTRLAGFYTAGRELSTPCADSPSPEDRTEATIGQPRHKASPEFASVAATHGACRSWINKMRQGRSLAASEYRWAPLPRHPDASVRTRSSVPSARNRPYRRPCSNGRARGFRVAGAH